jgi:hypothetical protein
MNEVQNQPAAVLDVHGYGVFPPAFGVVAVFKMPPPRPTGGSVSVQEGYSGGSYSGSSDPGGIDFGDAPVIHLF